MSTSFVVIFAMGTRILIIVFACSLSLAILFKIANLYFVNVTVPCLNFTVID